MHPGDHRESTYCLHHDDEVLDQVLEDHRACIVPYRGLAARYGVLLRMFFLCFEPKYQIGEQNEYPVRSVFVAIGNESARSLREP